MRRLLHACLVGMLVCGLSIDAARAGWFMRHGGRHHATLPTRPCASPGVVISDVPLEWSPAVGPLEQVEEIPCGAPLDVVTHAEVVSGDVSIPATPTIPAESTIITFAEDPQPSEPAEVVAAEAAPAGSTAAAEEPAVDPLTAVTAAEKPADEPVSEPEMPAGEEPAAEAPAADPFEPTVTEPDQPQPIEPMEEPGEPLEEPAVEPDTPMEEREEDPAAADVAEMTDEPEVMEEEQPEPLEENLFEKVDALDSIPADVGGVDAADSVTPSAAAEEPAAADDAEAMEEPAAEPVQDPFGDLDPAPTADDAEMTDEPAAEAAADEAMEDAGDAPEMEEEPAAIPEEPAEDTPPADDAAPPAAEEPADAPEPEAVVVEPLRRWIDATGGYSIVGTLEAVDAAAARIRTPAGRLLVVPLERLSDHDRGYATEAAARLGRGSSAGETAGL